MRPLVFLACLSALWIPSPANPPARALAGLFPATYDTQIKEAWETWHPGEQWQWGKAQFFQESRLDPSAKSQVGAVGIAQFMPATWGDVPGYVRLGIVDRRVAEPSIRGGAWYMYRLKRIWKSRRPESDRRELAQASYNAGAGSLIRAQRLCNGARNYPCIMPCLARVTGDRNANQTATYVVRIRRWFGLMR